jgi:hypothetical protein
VVIRIQSIPRGHPFFPHNAVMMTGLPEWRCLGDSSAVADLKKAKYRMGSLFRSSFHPFPRWFLQLLLLSTWCILEQNHVRHPLRWSFYRDFPPFPCVHFWLEMSSWLHFSCSISICAFNIPSMAQPPYPPDCYGNPRRDLLRDVPY